jgi:hypothetical protein
MSGGALQEIRRILERGAEPDDALREIARTLAAETGIGWAGIAFREQDELLLGPHAGTPDETRRTRIVVSFQGDEVGELWVDGEAEPALLDEVAQLVSPLVLIGWDTGGEAWEP